MADIDRVFKAYDVRGRTDTGELDAGLARGIGAAFSILMGAETIAVGRDVRESSPGLFLAMVEGITDQGVNVLDLGEVATDTVYYISGARSIPGVMITASHNPSEYNGIKLCGPGAAPVGSESGLAEIKQMILDGIPAGPGGGTTERFDPIPGYVDHIFGVVESEKIGPLRVAVDGGNGMAGVVLDQVFARMAAILTGLYLEPDGTFPNHPADPLQPENIADLVALVTEGDFDLGVAFDGDADRAFFVDDKGAPLSGSTTTALVATWFLARNPGATIVHNLITSRAVPETIQSLGGFPVRTRVGHSFIKQVMAETGAVFGGEHSGHYYFKDNFRADSGMLAMLVLLQVLSESGQKLSELRTGVEPYVASGEINLRVDDRDATIEKVAEAMAGAASDRLDGLTVQWEDRWFNLRPSNTEPYVRLNVEAPDQAAVDELVARVKAVVEA